MIVKWLQKLTTFEPNNSDMVYARRVVQRQRQREEQKKDTPEMRQRKIEKCFQRCKVQMVVQEDNFLSTNDCETRDDVDYGVPVTSSSLESDAMSLDEDGGLLKLPCPEGSAVRTVPDCCAVCLASYQAGETIVWSACPEKCPHVFHQDCVMDWFTKMQRGTPCPCCRQEFTDFVQHEKKRNKAKYKAAQTQFNVGVISL